MRWKACSLVCSMGDIKGDRNGDMNDPWDAVRKVGGEAEEDTIVMLSQYSDTSFNGQIPSSGPLQPPTPATSSPKANGTTGLPNFEILLGNLSLAVFPNGSEIFNNSDKYAACDQFPALPFCNDSYPGGDEDAEEPSYAFIINIVVPIIFGLVVLVGLFGNTLVVIVIIANRQMRSTTNYLIFR
ncbi:hypothetical protein HAZT_HAZT008373 [Hyalella azteca]|uniref:G-protein coupled receptors family 1 profile domain-containing protein n=1 Tax=Hyalella azteca TaxID=294128 RepID=A0A6A0GZ33_HYAAZ|nr:hypothetical protein HAZT_HAZT008373 [Hyalella azteca]